MEKLTSGALDTGGTVNERWRLNNTYGEKKMKAL